MVGAGAWLFTKKRMASLFVVISIFSVTSGPIRVLAVAPTAAQKTINDLTQVIKLHPKNNDAYRQRAEAYASIGNYANAVADYTQAIKLVPRNFYYHDTRALSYEKQGLTQQAVEDFDKAVELAPHNFMPYLHRGDYYLRQDQAQKAVDSYSQAIRLEPRQPQPYLNRAKAYAQLKDFDRALADNDRAIGLIPHNKFKSSYGFVYINRAEICMQQGQNSKAIDNCTKAITLQSKDWTAYRVRGAVRGGQNDYYGAIADLSRAINLNPDCAECYVLRARSYQKIGKDKDANDDLSRASELDPSVLSDLPGTR